MQLPITKKLFSLRAAYVAEGFDLYFVGGMVRDMLRGENPKDIDLCTDANPDEQIAIYVKHGVSYHETGLQHGTITVVLDDVPYEITSLRTETDHDGRHATVSYTKDLLEDLSRRDLTINSMAVTFDGDLIDPYNGAEDLKNDVVRFVGVSEERIREDYLRILRFYRFHARYAGNGPIDQDAAAAITAAAEGLKGISRERVWMEMAKIVVHENAVDTFRHMQAHGVFQHIDLSEEPFHVLSRVNSTNPVTKMVSYLNHSEQKVRELATKWKWSAEDRDLGIWLCGVDPTMKTGCDFMWMLAHDEERVDWVRELSKLLNQESAFDAVVSSPVPTFPVRGQDLIDAGMKPGKVFGTRLRYLRAMWAANGYGMTKVELMALNM